jgi:purine nucleosidase
MPRQILLDCDPGLDDALALLLAHGDPNLELVAVTTVGGKDVTISAKGAVVVAPATAPAISSTLAAGAVKVTNTGLTSSS